MERATKWDPGQSKASDAALRFYSQLKLLEDQQATSVSVVTSLQSELEEARAQISDLEAERRMLRKKLDHFLKKAAEEKAAWRGRELEKATAAIDELKEALARERKNRRRTEMVNSKLVSELAEAELAAKRHLHECEKERKARELVEEVCDELAKEIGEDKAELEALRREAAGVRDEVEEERKMLQMAEVWREERVQMKLMGAKLALEEKYSLLSKLQAELEAFLRGRGGSAPGDAAAVREAELLRDAAESAAALTQEMEEFRYQPPAPSEDIFSVFEELRPGEHAGEREVELCYDRSHPVSPEDGGGGGGVGAWTAPATGKKMTVGGKRRAMLRSRDQAIPLMGATQGRQRGDDGGLLGGGGGEPAEEEDGVDHQAVAVVFFPERRRLRREPVAGGKVAAELGMKKACVEWPRGIQKQSLKAKLLEARLESQKIQLRHVLRQKI
ncbi:unnamed protein product [Spirodela intermedia]|uniref:Uncharacterized protein n=1 Tax=Spirodela intermedia TaxID=51605 RepID=A0A7I8JP63_SPIIN|nr:unnamed protein product [Spirodela intermedia]CAA6671946.1 unnamed protein product [Spirodela intermedia]